MLSYNKDNLWKKFFLGASFTIFVMYLFYFKNLIDFWFIEKIGYEAVAGFQLVFPLIFLTIAIWEGISIAVNNLVSKSLGEKDYLKKDKYINIAFFFSFILFALFYFFGEYIVNYFISFFEVSQIVKNLAFEYGSIILKYSGIYYFNAIIWALVIVYHRYLLQIFIGILYVSLNIFFNWLFFYKFSLGIKGIAYASVLVELVLFLIGIFYFIFVDRIFKFNIKFLKQKFILYFKNYLKYFIGAFFSIFVFVFEFISNNYFVSKFGDGALAAYGMIKIFFDFVSYPIFGIGVVFASIYGYFLGEKNFELLNYFKLNFLKGYFIYLFLGMIVLFNGFFIFKLFFSLNYNIEVYLSFLLKIFSVFFLFFGLNFLYSQILQVLGYHKIRILFNVLLVFFIISFEFIFYKLFNKFEYLWFGWLLAQILVTLFLLIYWKFVINKNGYY